MAKRYKRNIGSTIQKSVIIVRVSSREQENGQSIDAQVDKTRNYCKKHGFDIAKEFIITESSTKAERKKFYEMLEFVKKYPGKIIIVADCVDRMQRSFREHAVLDTMRMSDKIEMHFVRDNQIVRKDSNSSEKLFWNMSVLVAQNYTDASSDNIKRSQEAMFKKGHFYGQAPVGYSNLRDKAGNAYITLHPEKAPLVKRIFEAYNAGEYSITGLIKFAKDIGLRSHKGNPLARNSIYKMLINSFYYGVMVVKGKEGPHIHGNIITKELFDSVQDKLIGNSCCTFKRGYSTEPFIFRNLVRCTCGSILSPEKKIKKSGKEYRYLKCSHYYKHCTQKPINENVLLKQIKEQIFDKLYVDPETLVNLKSLVKKELEEEHKQDVLVKSQTIKALESVATKKRRLVDMLAREAIDDITFHEQKAEYEAEELELRAKMDKINQSGDKFEEMANCIFDFAANAGEIFKSPKIDVKHQLLKILVSDSVATGSKLKVTLEKPFDFFVKNDERLLWRREGDSNSRNTFRFVTPHKASVSPNKANAFGFARIVSKSKNIAHKTQILTLLIQNTMDFNVDLMCI